MCLLLDGLERLCLQKHVHDCLGKNKERVRMRIKKKGISFHNKLRGLLFLNCYFDHLALETQPQYD